MSFERDGRRRRRALGVVQLASLVVLLSAVLGVGIHGVVGGLAGAVPTVTFAFEYDETSQTLVIIHEGGDAVDASSIRLAGVDADRGCGTDGWDTERITAGDSCTLEGVPADAEVRVVWDGIGPDTTTLDSWVGPDA